MISFRPLVETALSNPVLAALSMHTQLREEDAKIYDSLSIWSTLRRALVAMVSPAAHVPNTVMPIDMIRT